MSGQVALFTGGSGRTCKKEMPAARAAGVSYINQPTASIYEDGAPAVLQVDK